MILNKKHEVGTLRVEMLTIMTTFATAPVSVIFKQTAWIEQLNTIKRSTVEARKDCSTA